LEDRMNATLKCTLVVVASLFATGALAAKASAYRIPRPAALWAGEN
jgi:hypothetical protein